MVSRVGFGPVQLDTVQCQEAVASFGGSESLCLHAFSYSGFLLQRSTFKRLFKVSFL